MTRTVLVAITATLALVCAACAEESTTKDRTNVDTPGTTDGGSSEASTTADAGTPDPDDGRDTDPASCYAACQNTSFVCGALIATLGSDPAGCVGTIGPAGGGATQTLKLDCGAKKVCVEDACVDGRYSAFTFAYTPAGGTQVVCTRE